MNQPVLIMAGGTGGHIFPALAVAEQLAKRDVPVVWLGSEGGMETRLVPKHGIEIKTLSIKGLRGKGITTLLFAPFKLSMAVWQAIKVLRELKPQSVLGMGGFAAGPGGIAAFMLRIPLYVHEQNAIPGMTNRWLAKVSRKVMEGFDGAFSETLSPIYLGNPVRGKIVDVQIPAERFKSREGAIKLLIVGGSLGAMKFNQVVPETLANLDASIELDVMHQAGVKTFDIAEAAYSKAGVEADVTAFIDDMATAYAEADLVIARSGALTITELAQVGVASILVPYPYAVDDHQTANGKALVDAGAAIMIKDSEFTVDSLSQAFEGLLRNRERLVEMGMAAHTLARPESAANVAVICLGEETDAENKKG